MMSDNEFDEDNFLDADAASIDRFEQSWLENQPLEISSCLPQPSDPTFLGTLEELTHIDREFRWKQHQSGDSDALRPLEWYWQTYPELEPLKLGLIQGEFELANRFGDNVSVDQFIDRFGDTVAGQSLRPLLEKRLQQWRGQQPVRPGTTLGRYEIVNEHGRGGFGAVWRARDTKLGRRIAVKQLGQRLAHDAESRRRFISEARVTARLEHPGIVPVYDISNVQEDHAYYTMRLIKGRTLAEAIDDLNQLDVNSDEYRLRKRKLLQSLIDACRTIEYAHAQGVVHRDLKPQNIIVGDYGETILLDWGLASVIDQPEDPEENAPLATDPDVLTAAESVQTLRGNALGTPAYMPPEQARGDLENVGFHSDIYSLGASLYHLATGQIPFTDGSLAELMDRVKTGQLPSADTINPAVEKPLAAIVSRAMATEPTDRYRNVAALVDDLQRFLADQPVSAYRDPWWARMARKIRQHPTATAVLGISTLFVVLAVAVAWIANDAWRARETERLNRLRVAAERSDATALSQIASGDFAAAVDSLRQARDLLGDEPALAELNQSLAEREQRTEKIVRFYQLSSRAQEATFLDQPDVSGSFCQAAVNQLQILDHPDWWVSLPAEDLSETQHDQLRAEVYRILTLLASMRLANISQQTITMDMLLNPQAVEPDSPAAKSLQAAGFAARAANRFRPSRAMRLIEELADFSLNQGQAVDLTDLNPRNPIDSAVMGSILDNNVPTGVVRNAMSAVLEMRDPNEVAKQWLNDALKESPDWYWLPVFVGHSQIRTGNPEAGIQTISHAVGVRPDFWVGYQYRAKASVAAAQLQTSRPRRSELLNAANRDIQRALDLQPDNSELYWMKAWIQILQNANSEAIIDTYLEAYALHPELAEIGSGHFSGITKEFIDQAQAFIELQKSNDQVTPKLLLLEATGALWQQEFQAASELIAGALTKYPEHEELRSMEHWIQTRLEQRSDDIEFTPESRFAWRYVMANASLHQRQGNLTRSLELLEQAQGIGRAMWQQTRTQVETVKTMVLAGMLDEAQMLLKETFQLDQSAKFDLLEPLIEQHGGTELENTFRQVRTAIAERVAYPESSEIEISSPALLNGGFELGLSQHWAPFARRQMVAVWNNRGGSRSSAMLSKRDPQAGNNCLEIQINSPRDEESFGWMSQAFPVTPGRKYRIQAWVKTDQLEDDALLLGIGSGTLGQLDQSITVDAGTADWSLLELEFEAQSSTTEFAVKAQGSGKTWIDEIQISSVDSLIEERP